MPNRIVALKYGTVLCAALLAGAGGYAGAQTAPKAVPVVTAAPAAAPPLSGLLPTPRPTVAVGRTQTSAPATTFASTTALQIAPQSTPTIAQTRTASIATTPTGTAPLRLPARTREPVVAAAPTNVPTVAFSGHGVTGTVVRRQDQSFIVRPATGPDVRVMVDRGTLIRSQSGGGARLPQAGDQTVAVGAPRPDGALAALAMLISPPARNASPRRR